MTDSEIRDKWISNRAQLAKLRGKPNKSRREELERSQHVLRVEWNENLERRRRGQLTDRTNLDLASRTLKEVSLVRGLQINVHEKEGPRGEDDIARWWFLVAVVGKDAKVGDAELSRFGAAVTEELLEVESQLNYDLLWAEVPPDRESQEELDLSDFFQREETVLGWRVMTSVWTGPGRRR